MTNLRLTKAAVRPGRLLWVAAAGVAVLATIFPAQGAAARKRHQLHRPHAQLAQHTLHVEGTEANDAIALRLAAGNPAVLQVDIGDNGSADFSFPRASINRISVAARGGNDRVRIDDTNGTFTDAIPTSIDGGRGNDTIVGGAGSEKLNGGPGNDSIDGKGGTDVSDLGPGDDSFVWDPGDGSDTIEGGGGTDTMVFDGAAASETVDLSANGHRLRFFRSPGNVTMDTHGVEQVAFNALGGADSVTVNDLAGTGVTNVGVDLAGTLGGTTGDGQTDRVVRRRHQRKRCDHRCRRHVRLHSLGPPDAGRGPASGADRPALRPGVGGNDASPPPVSPRGPSGVPERRGRQRHDRRGPGRGNAAGRQTATTRSTATVETTCAGLGAGGDTFVWDPGDGSDTIEGEDGKDTLVFNGAAARIRSTCRRTGTGCASALRGTSRWTPTESSGGLQRARRRRRDHGRRT